MTDVGWYAIIKKVGGEKYEEVKRKKAQNKANSRSTLIGRQRWLVQKAKDRARKKGLEHNITWEDIYWPKTCPVLNKRLKYMGGVNKRGIASPYAASLDRRDNSLGYVKGNVYVISWRANALKSNATYEELSAVLRYIGEEAYSLSDLLGG